jgi:hypothetical protein
MVDLACARDLAKLGIRTWDGGLNITAFLDHLEACDHCKKAKGALIVELNKAIGGREAEGSFEG